MVQCSTESRVHKYICILEYAKLGELSFSVLIGFFFFLSFLFFLSPIQFLFSLLKSAFMIPYIPESVYCPVLQSAR